MRKILFRGKRIDNNEWTYGDLIQDGRGYVGMWAQTPSAVNYEVESKTIGEYTGCTDKNGKRVFEGDILRVELCGETGSRICPVYFGEYIDADSVFDDYRCIGFYVKTSDGCGNIGFLLTGEFKFEIVGNVYDNPELLECGKDENEIQ